MFDKSTYYPDSVIAPEYLGFTSLFCPTPTHVASVRVDMVTSSLRQYVVLRDPEQPAWATAFEDNLLDYTYDTTRRENDVQVVDLIQKYTPRYGYTVTEDVPMRTVIYQDKETQEIGYFNIHRTQSIACEFGWENIPREININPPNIIRKEERLVDSPATTNDVYKMGTNARVATISLGPTIEDAFVVSDHFANRMQRLKTQKISIKLKINSPMMGLNLFGKDDENYQIIPRIGDIVRPDGIVAAFRKFDEKTVFFDLLGDKLKEVNEAIDKLYVTKLAGGEVYDVDVIVGRKEYLDATPFRLLREYYERRMGYYAQVVENYEKKLKEGCSFTPEMNTLVTDAMGKLLADGRPVPGFLGKRLKVSQAIKNKVPFIQVDIYIRKYQKLNIGDKVATRHGHKGICCQIIPRAYMPVDDFGFIADILFDPTSSIKRTNPGNLHEIWINRTGEWIVKFMDEKFDNDEAKFRECMDFYQMIYPIAGADVEAAVRMKRAIPHYLQMVREMEHIPIQGLPAPKSVNSKLPDRLVQRFGVQTSEVEFVSVNWDGQLELKRTKVPVAIGKSYCFFINKGAQPSSPGFGYVNKLHQPINNQAEKLSSAIRLSPYRFGEDDRRMFAVANCHEEFARLSNLLGNSTLGPEVVIRGILKAQNPARIKRFPISDADLANNNQSINSFINYTRAAGIELQETRLTQQQGDRIMDKIAKSYFTALGGEHEA